MALEALYRKRGALMLKFRCEPKNGTCHTKSVSMQICNFRVLMRFKLKFSSTEVLTGVTSGKCRNFPNCRVSGARVGLAVLREKRASSYRIIRLAGYSLLKQWFTKTLDTCIGKQRCNGLHSYDFKRLISHNALGNIRKYSSFDYLF